MKNTLALAQSWTCIYMYMYNLTLLYGIYSEACLFNLACFFLPSFSYLIEHVHVHDCMYTKHMSYSCQHCFPYESIMHRNESVTIGAIHVHGCLHYTPSPSPSPITGPACRSNFCQPKIDCWVHFFPGPIFA